MEFESGETSPVSTPVTTSRPNNELCFTATSSTVAAPATRKLLIGPTTAVKMSSRTGCLKFRGSTGVGLAQPSIGMCASSAIKGSKMVPNKSTCLMGLSVIRPNMRAVGSPQRFAIQAWEDSCTLIANRNTIT